MDRIAENYLARLVNCIPPAGEYPYRKTGQQTSSRFSDIAFDIFKPRFHTCGVEWWNGVCISRNALMLSLHNRRTLQCMP